VVNNHLRKVDAARSFASQTAGIEAKVLIFRGLLKIGRATRLSPIG
jgi:hypothetical protein